jgi:hypothetical protein
MATVTAISIQKKWGNSKKKDGMDKKRGCSKTIFLIDLL